MHIFFDNLFRERLHASPTEGRKTMYFDTHAHFDDDAFDADRDELMCKMRDAGVELIVNPGCNEETSRKALEYAQKYDIVYAAVGWHPETCGDFTDESLAILRELAASPYVKAIGEIGLDYYWDENPPKEFQKEVFERQMLLAEELGLPVIVHDREAHADCMEVVRRHPNVKGVFHCYSGSAEMAKELVRLGWYISFTGTITFKNAKKAPEVVAAIPIERIMIETDSPYMSPEPNRGKRNDSSNLVYIARKIAEIKGLTEEEVAEITTRNGKEFYNI